MRFSVPNNPKNFKILLGGILIVVAGFLFYQGVAYLVELNKPTLIGELKKTGRAGEEILEDFSFAPAEAFSEEKAGFVVEVDKKAGIQIDFAGDAQKNEEKEGEKMRLNFPKDYQKPLEVKLDDRRSILIQDQNAQNFEAKTFPLEKNEEKDELPFLLGGVDSSQKSELENYLSYASNDLQKTHYYSFQNDEARGERKLKNWIIYQLPKTKEVEKYVFQNAALAKETDGSVSVRYFDQQMADSQKAMVDVDQNLLERARRTLEKDGESLEGDAPVEFSIPQPYYIDNNGDRTELEWKISSDKKELSLEFSAKPEQYPLALDPTLQFTAPGTSSTGDVITGETGTHLGRSLATGDFNADGKTDLAVGAYGYSGNTGRIYIFYNDGSVSDTAIAADVIISGEAANNIFSYPIIAGDFNADGKTDLVVGAYGYSTGTGRVYIFYNDGSYPNMATNADVIITGQSINHNFGLAISSGDLNADGQIDLVVGATGYATNTGRAYIFYNDGSIPTAAASADVVITGQTSSYFANSFVTGDMNSDGKTDLVVGATGYPSNTNVGRAYIFYNDGSIPTAAASADVIITGESNGNVFSYAMVTGDFNTDGKTDLAIGAYGYSTSTGRAYIFYNDGSIPTAAASADVIITGQTTSNYFGAALSAGDFNADGKTDLAVGAYIHSSNTGRAYIFYNDGSIPTAADSADVIISGEASSYFGYTLSSGDLNSDGKTDLVVVADNYATGTGRTYIFYSQNGQVNLNSSITGEVASNNFGAAMTTGDFNSDGRIDLAVGAYGYSTNVGRTYIFMNDGAYPAAAASADIIIAGEAGTYFGYALTAGDFNTDGRTDLAVGAYGYSSITGRTYVFLNDGSIPTTSATADIIITGEATNNYFGYPLVSGDFNSDGKTDLAVGAFGYASNTGRAYVFLNDGSIPTAAASADTIITGEAGGNYFAIALASGDFNTDGKTDLAAGAYANSSSAGRAYIFLNDGSIPTAAASADTIISGEASSNLGVSLVSGDFNADGRVDLAAGAYSYSSGAGRTYIFYNDGSIPTAADSADVTITGEASSYFGSYLASGDLNADGRIDLIVGGYAYSTNTGRVYVFMNDGSISTTAATADVIIAGETTNNYFASFCVGDFNADGKMDLAIDAYGYSGNTGRIYFYETRDDYSWQLQKQLTANTLRTNKDVGQELDITGEGGNLGISAAVGDFNADGKTDLAVGAFQFSTDVGRAYIFFNDGSLETQAAKADVVITGDAGSKFGYPLSAGDFNADGKIDLAAGGFNYSSVTGRVYIFYNDGFYPTAAASADVIVNGEAASNEFGVAMAAGDFNADGKTDLAVGADFYASNAGRVYIFYNDGTYPTSAASADVNITGSEADSFFGRNLSAGDFNADGKTDLAVGAHGINTYTGRVYIFYNDGAYPAAATSAEAIISGDSGGSFFGYPLIAGDFNADGKTDLAVGAYAYSTNTGRVYIFYNDGAYPNSAASADVIIIGEAANNYFGASLAAGDFNADGKTDLAVGASGYSSTTGRVHIFYNDGSIPTAAASADVVLTGETASDAFGYSVASGDFNADGKIDLVVGAYAYSSGLGRTYLYTLGNDKTITGEASSSYFGSAMVSGDFNADGKTDLAVGAYSIASYAGRVYIFLNDGLLPAASASADVVISGEANSYFGYSFAAGDFNFDGKTDLAVGATRYGTYTGRAYIFYNDGSIPTAASSADVIISGETSNNYFGNSMASGDFNADGRTDLTVGAYGNSSNTGRTYIFHNDGSIPTAASSADVAISGQASGDYFGYPLAAGDFNADGRIDLAAGAFGYSGSIGRAYIFYNDGSIPTAAASADVAVSGEASGNQFGSALSAGDFNADGKTDLAAGALVYSGSTGRAYIFTNDGAFPTSAANADNIITGEAASNEFGVSLLAGDFNADGKIDLAVGARRHATYTGRVYVFNNDGSYPTSASSADVLFSGEATNSSFGYLLCSGDFNTDGKADMIIGAHGYTSDTGRVYIYATEAATVGNNPNTFQFRGNFNLKGNMKMH